MSCFLQFDLLLGRLLPSVFVGVLGASTHHVLRTVGMRAAAIRRVLFDRRRVGQPEMCTDVHGAVLLFYGEQLVVGNSDVHMVSVGRTEVVAGRDRGVEQLLPLRRVGHAGSAEHSGADHAQGSLPSSSSYHLVSVGGVALLLLMVVVERVVDASTKLAGRLSFASLPCVRSTVAPLMNPLGALELKTCQSICVSVVQTANFAAQSVRSGMDGIDAQAVVFCRMFRSVQQRRRY